MPGKKGRNEYRKNALTKKLAYGLVILVLFVFISYFAITLSTRPQEYVPLPSELKAAIIDQLSLTVEANLTKTFKENATNILKQANFTVDYYSGEKVTVNFYANLPLQNYKIIILRVHSTAGQRIGGKLIPSFTVLFTSERYEETKYIEQQRTVQLVRVYYTTPYGEGESYFGITPNFVKQSMKGSFSNATILLMGCEGFNQETAQAFVEKGAKVYIGWNASVSAPHTDLATIHLLRHLTIEKLDVETAVTETMNEVDPDPTYHSQLMFYPLEAGSYIIQNLISNSEVDIAQIKRKNLSFYHFVLCDL